MLVTLFGIVMLIKLLQPSNVLFSMVVTPTGIVMLVKPLQSSNALYLMLVTPSGIVMLVKLLQPRNAELGISVISFPLEKLTVVRLVGTVPKI